MKALGVFVLVASLLTGCAGGSAEGTSSTEDNVSTEDSQSLTTAFTSCDFGLDFGADETWFTASLDVTNSSQTSREAAITVGWYVAGKQRHTMTQIAYMAPGDIASVQFDDTAIVNWEVSGVNPVTCQVISIN